jgi:hypothetical protein
MVDHIDVAGYVLGTLTTQETIEFEAHLEGCERCRAELAELGSLPSMLADAELAPPPALRQRTFDAMAAAQAPGGRAGVPVEPVEPVAPRVSGFQESRIPPRPAAPVGDGVVVPFRSRRRTAQWLGAAAAALLLVAAVAIGGVVLTRGGGSTTTIALVAAEGGPGRGTAVLRNVKEGREVRLDVSGLPANTPGTYYECWFVGPGDTEQRPNRVSAGTFTVGSDGTASMVMISAADPARFPKMGVTLEPDDGNPARTGPKYLITP